MRVSNVSTFSREHYVRMKPKFEEPASITVESVEEDGCFVQKCKTVPYDEKSDIRKQLNVLDFSIGTIIANDGVKALKECKFNVSAMDNADRLDDTLASVDSLRESQAIINNVESKPVENE